MTSHLEVRSERNEGAIPPTPQSITSPTLISIIQYLQASRNPRETLRQNAVVFCLALNIPVNHEDTDYLTQFLEMLLQRVVGPRFFEEKPPCFGYFNTAAAVPMVSDPMMYTCPNVSSPFMYQNALGSDSLTYHLSQVPPNSQPSLSHQDTSETIDPINTPSVLNSLQLETTISNNTPVNSLNSIGESIIQNSDYHMSSLHLQEITQKPSGVKPSLVISHPPSVPGNLHSASVMSQKTALENPTHKNKSPHMFVITSATPPQDHQHQPRTSKTASASSSPTSSSGGIPSCGNPNSTLLEGSNPHMNFLGDIPLNNNSYTLDTQRKETQTSSQYPHDRTITSTMNLSDVEPPNRAHTWTKSACSNQNMNTTPVPSCNEVLHDAHPRNNRFPLCELDNLEVTKDVKSSVAAEVGTRVGVGPSTSLSSCKKNIQLEDLVEKLTFAEKVQFTQALSTCSSAFLEVYSTLRDATKKNSFFKHLETSQKEKTEISSNSTPCEQYSHDENDEYLNKHRRKLGPLLHRLKESTMDFFKSCPIKAFLYFSIVILKDFPLFQSCFRESKESGYDSCFLMTASLISELLFGTDERFRSDRSGGEKRRVCYCFESGCEGGSNVTRGTPYSCCKCASTRVSGVPCTPSNRSSETSPEHKSKRYRCSSLTQCDSVLSFGSAKDRAQDTVKPKSPTNYCTRSIAGSTQDSFVDTHDIDDSLITGSEDPKVPLCDASDALFAENQLLHRIPPHLYRDLPPRCSRTCNWEERKRSGFLFNKNGASNELTSTASNSVYGPMPKDISPKDELLLQMPEHIITKTGVILPPSNSRLYLSKVVGVVWDKIHNSWVVNYTLMGRRYFQHFPAKKYGFLEGRQLAIELRLAKDQEKSLVEGVVRGGGRRAQNPRQHNGVSKAVSSGPNTRASEHSSNGKLLRHQRRGERHSSRSTVRSADALKDVTLVQSPPLKVNGVHSVDKLGPANASVVNEPKCNDQSAQDLQPQSYSSTIDVHVMPSAPPHHPLHTQSPPLSFKHYPTTQQEQQREHQEQHRCEQLRSQHLLNRMSMGALLQSPQMHSPRLQSPLQMLQIHPLPMTSHGGLSTQSYGNRYVHKPSCVSETSCIVSKNDMLHTKDSGGGNECSDASISNDGSDGAIPNDGVDANSLHAPPVLKERSTRSSPLLPCLDDESENISANTPNISPVDAVANSLRTPTTVGLVTGSTSPETSTPTTTTGGIEDLLYGKSTETDSMAKELHVEGPFKLLLNASRSTNNEVLDLEHDDRVTPSDVGESLEGSVKDTSMKNIQYDASSGTVCVTPQGSSGVPHLAEGCSTLAYPLSYCSDDQNDVLLSLPTPTERTARLCQTQEHAAPPTVNHGAAVSSPSVSIQHPIAQDSLNYPNGPMLVSSNEQNDRSFWRVVYSLGMLSSQTQNNLHSAYP